MRRQIQHTSYLFILFLALHISVSGQTLLEDKLKTLKELNTQSEVLKEQIEELKLKELIESMKQIGTPQSSYSLELIQHHALFIGFDCEYKMARWTMHILTPDVSFGQQTRSNDFRIDEQVSCGTAVEADYFVRKEREDGTFSYDGFGYDRGHLAPSADFKWSAKALSESYFYSNMTPQHPDFNRDSWASLEALVRTIVDLEKKNLYIITGPILHDKLPIIERSVNHLRIPEWHYKVIVDLSADTPRGMAFLMPNQKCQKRLSEYVVSIDSIEQLTGLNFFPTLDPALEAKIEEKADYQAWKTQTKQGDVEPLPALSLPKGFFNTKQAETKVGSNVSIVGKVVSTKYLPASQSTFLNLDQSFPNQLFTIQIWKDGRRNFSYKPEVELKDKYIVVTGRVELDKNGIPVITVTKEEQIREWE